MTNQLQLPPPYHHHTLTARRGRIETHAFKPVKTAHPVTRPRLGHQHLISEPSASRAIAVNPRVFTAATRATLSASTDEIDCSPICYCWPSTIPSVCPGLPYEGDTRRFCPHPERYQRRYQGGTERYQHLEKAVPPQYHPVRRYRPGITFSPVLPRRYPVPPSRQGDTEAIRAASTARTGIASIVLTPLTANAVHKVKTQRLLQGLGLHSQT